MMESITNNQNTNSTTTIVKQKEHTIYKNKELEDNEMKSFLNTFLDKEI
jgi:hypothetical protein